jgi:hypothetical protein
MFTSASAVCSILFQATSVRVSPQPALDYGFRIDYKPQLYVADVLRQVRIDGARSGV